MFIWFVGQFIDRLILLIQIVIVAHIVLSWIRVPSNKFTEPIKRFVYEIAEPILGMFRSVIPTVMIGGMGLDLTPMIAILILGLIGNLVHMILRLL